MKLNMVSPDEKRKIQTPAVGYIPPLGISGPIPFPIEVSSRRVYNLVQQGYVIYETSKKTGKRIRLTLQNCNRKDRFGEEEAHLDTVTLNNGKMDITYVKPEPEVTTEDYGTPVEVTPVKEPDLEDTIATLEVDEDETPCIPPDEPELVSRNPKKALMVNGKINDFIPPPEPPAPEPKKENPNIVYYNDETDSDDVEEELSDDVSTNNSNQNPNNNRNQNKKKRRR